MKRLLQASDAAEKCQSVYLLWKIGDISAAVPNLKRAHLGIRKHSCKPEIAAD